MIWLINSLFLTINTVIRSTASNTRAHWKIGGGWRAKRRHFRKWSNAHHFLVSPYIGSISNALLWNAERIGLGVNLPTCDARTYKWDSCLLWIASSVPKLDCRRYQAAKDCVNMSKTIANNPWLEYFKAGAFDDPQDWSESHPEANKNICGKSSER